MKRIIPILMIIFILAAMSACAPAPEADNDGKLSIVTTIFPQYDIARSLAGNCAEVSMLIPAGSETHSFEPTTSDVLRISECDIFIYTGGDSDDWIDGILNNINNKDMTVISLMDCVGADSHHHHSHDHHDHHDVHTDEHVWTSPKNTALIAAKICDSMCKKDSLNSETYRSNLSNLQDKLEQLDRDFRSVCDNAKRKTLVFADRYPLTHFSEEYGLDYIAAFPGCSEDTEASAYTIKKLIDKVKSEQIPVILKIELSSDNIAKTVQAETGADIMTFYSCHNISKSDFDNGETYISLMQKNVETLRTALN